MPELHGLHQSCHVAKMTKRLAAGVLLFMPLVASIVWCGFSFSETLGKCDLEGYLVDQKTREELFDSLRDFERQHNLRFDYGYAAPGCTSEGVNVTLDYETPSRLSKYGIVYELLVSATYSPHSGLVTLQLGDEFSKTEDVLTHIDSLKDIITEFENSPQVAEFSAHFKDEGIDVRGTIYADSLWIETDPRLSFPKATPSVTASIFYSMPTRSNTSYSLPNRITWHEFPEIPVVHAIVNEQLLVGKLSNCVISTEKKAYANTHLIFRSDGSTRADVKMICNDGGEEKYLRLTLFPDGSYEYEVEE